MNPVVKGTQALTTNLGRARIITDWLRMANGARTRNVRYKVFTHR